MPGPTPGWPDWREEDEYAALLEADRPAFAWEWLRRTRGYRDAWQEAMTAPGRSDHEARAAAWGLHRLEPPELPALLARPLWRRDRHRYVLDASAEPCGPAEERLDLAAWKALATVHRSSAGEEHLLLSDGLRSIRLDIVAGTLQRGPARLSYRISGFADAAEPMMVLRRLLALRRTGRFSPGLHPTEVRARRWIQMLRGHDGEAAGASQREIAAILLSPEAASARWRIAEPTLRARVQRLVRNARWMAAGGYLTLLR